MKYKTEEILEARSFALDVLGFSLYVLYVLGIILAIIVLFVMYMVVTIAVFKLGSIPMILLWVVADTIILYLVSFFTYLKRGSKA